MVPVVLALGLSLFTFGLQGARMPVDGRSTGRAATCMIRLGVECAIHDAGWNVGSRSAAKTRPATPRFAEVGMWQPSRRRLGLRPGRPDNEIVLAEWLFARPESGHEGASLAALAIRRRPDDLIATERSRREPSPAPLLRPELASTADLAPATFALERRSP